LDFWKNTFYGIKYISASIQVRAKTWTKVAKFNETLHIKKLEDYIFSFLRYRASKEKKHGFLGSKNGDFSQNHWK